MSILTAFWTFRDNEYFKCLPFICKFKLNFPAANKPPTHYVKWTVFECYCIIYCNCHRLKLWWNFLFYLWGALGGHLLISVLQSCHSMIEVSFHVNPVFTSLIVLTIFFNAECVNLWFWVAYILSESDEKIQREMSRGFVGLFDRDGSFKDIMGFFWGCWESWPFRSKTISNI